MSEATANPDTVTDLTLREAGRTVLKINENCTVDQLVELMNTVQVFVDRAKDVGRALEDQIIEWCKVNGDLEHPNGNRYYCGTVTKTKCISVATTLKRLLALSELPLEDFCSAFLSSQPIKYGAAREPLGDEWGEHFSVEVVEDLKTGKPKKRLVNSAWSERKLP